MKTFNPKTVTIGNQVWMAENLAITDGGNGIHYNEDNKEVYYTWEAAKRVAESIPGWHLPTAIEWNEAAIACGATEKPCEENRNLNDYKDAQELKDNLGVKLIGYRYSGSFYSLGSNTNFWTATENSSTDAYYRNFSTGASMDSYYNDKTNYASSVRLVKDSTDNSNPDNPTDSLETSIGELDRLENKYHTGFLMVSKENAELKVHIKELENETKHMESLARMNKLLEEHNLAYKKLLETKDAEIAELRRSMEFYKNYYLEDKEMYRPAMLEAVRKLKAKIKEMEG